MTEIEYLQEQINGQFVAIKQLRRDITELKHGRESEQYQAAQNIYQEAKQKFKV